MTSQLVGIQTARLRLILCWFPASGVFILLLVIQSITGVHGATTEEVWSWALPNFMPTASLMLGVIIADMKPNSASSKHLVLNWHLRLAVGISIFYWVLLFLTVLSPPLVNFLSAENPRSAISIFRPANMWLGPVQALAAMAISALFYHREEAQNAQ